MSEAAPTKPCPICGKPADSKLKPFCSKRCANVDLNRWLSGVYATPAIEDEEEGELGDAFDEVPPREAGRRDGDG